MQSAQASYTPGKASTLLPISYMGTKRRLAPDVAAAISHCQPGRVLDLFSGMGAVPRALGRSRQVWINDVQAFASAVGSAQFCAPSEPPEPADALNQLLKAFRQEEARLIKLAHSRVAHEEKCLDQISIATLAEAYSRWSTETIRPGVENKKIGLFSDRFAGAYFGLGQCIEIDAILYAIRQIPEQVGEARHNPTWYRLALAVALNRATTSTGHFAQPLALSQRNAKRFFVQRRKSIWRLMLDALAEIRPVHTKTWRQRNVATCQDALSCLSVASSGRKRVAVVYADPPYTSDQYSRYYHLYETLLLEDYPGAVGRGRYRDDRYVSEYSLKSRAAEAIKLLIQRSREIEADLVLSYPSSGLIESPRQWIEECLSAEYGQRPAVQELKLEHSTMGGSKGSSKNATTELLFAAKRRARS